MLQGGVGCDLAAIELFFALFEAVPALIDLHIHLLADVDDGPGQLSETLEMARVAIAAGTTAVAVTPHVNSVYPTSVELMLERLDQAVAELARAGIELELRPGAEIALDQVERLSDHELRAFSLGGSGRYILLECPFSGWPMDLEIHTGRLAALGIQTVLAHPERCADVQRGEGLKRLSAAVGRGLLVQVNASSLTGKSGNASAIAARKMLRDDLVHLVASDAHGATRRAPKLDGVEAAIGDSALASWLTEDAPAAVLMGRSLPVRPPNGKPPRRGFFSRFNR